MDENLRIIAEFVDQASAGLERVRGAMDDITQSAQQQERAQDRANRATREAGNVANEANGKFSTFAKSMAGFLASVGAAALVMQGFVNAIQGADRLDDLAEKAGTTAANLRDLEYAATLSGTSLDGLLGAMSKLGRAADQSDEATSKQAQTFKQLGVNAMDSNGQLKSSEQLFMELADAFAGLEDGPEKSAAAFRLFGGEAKSLMPLLNKGAAGIAAMKKEAQELSGVAPEAFNAFAASSAELNDNLDKASTVSSGFFSTLAGELVPVVNIMAEAFLNSAKEGGFLRQILNGLVEGFKFLIPYVKAGAEVFSGFVSTVQIAGKSIGLVMAAIATVASGGGIAGLKAVWSAYKEDVQGVAQEHVTFTEKLNGTYHEAVKLADGLDKPKTQLRSLKKEAKETSTEMDKLLKTLTAPKSWSYGSDEVAAAYAKDIATANSAAEASLRAGANPAKVRLQLEQALGIAEKDNIQRRRQAAITEYGDNVVAYKAKKDALALLTDETTLIGKSADERERIVELDKQRAEMNKTVDSVVKGLSAGVTDPNALAQIQVLKKNYEELIQSYFDQANAIKKVGEESKIANEIFDQTLTSAQNNFTQRIQIAVKMMEEGKITLADFTAYQQAQYDQLLGKTKDTADKSKTFWEEAAKGMQDAMQTFFYDFMQGNMTNLVDDFQKMISKMVAQALAARLGEKLFGAGFEKGGGVGGYIGSGLSWLGSTFGGMRATGGPVAAGKAYVVGEHRPELFVPNTSGMILPSVGAMAGGGTTIEMHISAVDSKSFLAQMDTVKREVAAMVSDTTRKYNLGR